MPRFRQAITRNLVLKLSALLGGVAVWAFVATQPEMERPFEAAIHYVNVPPELELNPDQAERLTVIISGPRHRLDELSVRGLTAEVDFSGVYGPGEHTFTVSALSLNLPPTVRLLKSVPSQLRLLLENRIRRDVEVQPRFVGSYQPGYSLETFTVDPPRLTVAGPESRMALIDQVTTDPINLAEVIGTTSFRAMAYVPDPYVYFEQDAAVTVEVHMRKRP